MGKHDARLNPVSSQLSPMMTDSTKRGNSQMVSSQFNSQNDNLGKNCDLQSKETSIKFSRFASGSISDLLREVNLDEGVRKGIVTTDDPNTEVQVQKLTH